MEVMIKSTCSADSTFQWELGGGGVIQTHMSGTTDKTLQLCLEQQLKLDFLA